MRIPERLLVHEVTVEPYEGTGPFGETYGTPFPLKCFRDDASRRLVRDATGTQVVAGATLYCSPGQAASIPPDSRVTWDGNTTTVIVSHDHDDAGLGAPQHTEVVCA